LTQSTSIARLAAVPDSDVVTVCSPVAGSSVTVNAGTNALSPHIPSRMSARTSRRTFSATGQVALRRRRWSQNSVLFPSFR
jgi:hypothetical protein